MLKEFLVQNEVVAIVFVAVIVVVAVFLFVKAMQAVGLEKIRGYVYKLFVDAEHIFKHGENTAKFEYVVNLAKSVVPAPFNIFITEELLRTVVQAWFDICKDLLDDGKVNGSEV